MKTAKELELTLLVKEKTISDLKYEIMKKEQQIQELGESLHEYVDRTRQVLEILDRDYVDVVMLAKHDIIDIKKLLKKLLKVKK